MRSREDLIKENIELERTLMKFKKGLQMAVRVIEQYDAFDSVLVSTEKTKYDRYIASEKLRSL